MKNQLPFVFLILLGISACRTYQAKPYNFPNPVDTTDKPVELQEKKTYSIPQEGVFATNLFDGERLNNFEYLENNAYRRQVLFQREQ